MMSSIVTALEKPLFVAKADKLVAESGLPDSIKAVIARVVKRSRLWRSEKADVARELIAHFTDGLSSGRTADQLIADFGDPAKAAKLIRSGKRRTRPLWWQVQWRIRQGVVVFFALLVLAYIVQAIRFYTGSPTISRNYLAELNAPIIATPSDQRGYPIFLEAVRTLERVPRDVSGAPPVPSGADIGSYSFASCDPSGEQWPAMAAYVSRNAAGIALLRKAALMPHFGYVASSITDPDFSQAMLHQGIPLPDPQTPDENPNLISVLLPYLGGLRQSALLLNADLWLAAESHDAKRIESDLAAMIGLANHCREFPVLIGDLVAIAVLQRAEVTLVALLEKHPEVFTETTLQTIAATMSAFPGDSKPVIRFDAEKAMWHDVAQRIYTDDGHGNGRITADGIDQLMNSVGAVKSDAASGPLAPVVASVMGDRKKMTDRYDHFMDRTQALVDVPLWKRDDASIDSEIDRFLSSGLNKYRYFPLSVLLPALGKATLTAEQSKQRSDATLVALAIERYRRANTQPPASLNDLVPAYLPAIPPDRFDGGPIKYRRADNALGYVLYSVGTDLDDDAGVARAPASGSMPSSNRSDPSRWKPRSVVERMKADPNLVADLPDGDWILVPAPTDN